MVDEKFSHIVTEIEVSGSQKSWGNNPGQGHGGGTEITYRVIPASMDQNFWTLAEANIVALDVRCEIQRVLLTDAQLRKIIIPPEASKSLSEYREKVRLLKTSDPRLEWRDTFIDPPKSEDL